MAYASETWTKSYGPNYTKFWAFWQKKNVSLIGLVYQSVPWMESVGIETC